MLDNIKLEMFEDKIYAFYGVDNLWFKLDDKVYLAVEDDDDGYRSYLGSVEVANYHLEGDLIFFQKPIAFVRVVRENSGEKENIALIDVEDGHRWLEVGTDYADDYYPMFMFEYFPKRGDIGV